MHPGSSKTNISSAHITAAPTLRSWPHAYTAGTLFAVVSLLSKEQSEHLHTTGKELVNILEEEYFTLETKNLDTIKNAVRLVWEKFPKDMTGSLAVAAIINNASYLFAAGGANIVLKRGEKMGTILKGNDQEAPITSASGFLDDGDLLVLQTKDFIERFSIQTLLSSLKEITPAEVIDRVTPKVQEQEGGSAAIVVLYKEPLEKAAEEVPVIITESLTEEKEKTNPLTVLAKALKARLPTIPIRLPLSKKIMLVVAVVLLVILIGGIYLSTKRRYEAKLQTMHAAIAANAQKKYDEGQTLVELNKNLARDDFTQAKKILTEGKAQFPKGSAQAKQIDAFLQKVDEAILQTSAVNNVTATQVAESQSALLSYEEENIASGTSFTQDAATIYIANKNSITSVDKKTQKTKTLVKNANDWISATAVSTYLSNAYLLDSSNNQLLKFVAASSGYGKANYLASSITADFSTAVSMAIDGSVWVLFQDGRIQKFTRGKPEAFSINGLDTPFAKPVKIATGTDMSNLYVLDTGQGRIVALSKSGAYQSQYQAAVLQKAIDFEVREKEKKILFLADGKIWQIDIK